MPEPLSHPSSSHEHRSAEALILAGVAGQLGLDDLAPARLQLGVATVDLDGWSPATSTAVEVYARVTPPKGGAVKKPMDDAMRLLLVRSHHPDSRLVLAFASAAVADHFRTGRGWRPAALREAGIEVLDVDLDQNVLEQLAAATRRQFR